MSTPSRRLWQRAGRHSGLYIGVGLSLGVLLAAILSWFWTPHSAIDIDLGRKLLPPSSSHWLGTDVMGRDVVSQLLVGARSSVFVGIIAVGIGLVAGCALGLLAAARSGWIRESIMRLTDLTFAFPALLTAIMLTAIWGPGMVNAMVAIGIFNIPTFVRVSSAAAQSIWQREFVMAARAAGKTRWQITWEHILPNISAILLVQTSIQFAIAILAEAALSYLGLGTQPPQPSWGRMLADAQTLLFTHPMLAVYPGVAIALAVMGLNFLGDALRDIWDPRMPQESGV